MANRNLPLFFHPDFHFWVILAGAEGSMIGRSRWLAAAHLETCNVPQRRKLFVTFPRRIAVEDLARLDIKAIIDSMSDGVYVCDPDRKITYWSKSAERITGWSAEDVVGTPCFDNVLCHVDKDGHLHNASESIVAAIPQAAKGPG